MNIAIGVKAVSKYTKTGQQTAKVVGIGEAFTRGVSRPFKTLLEVQYSDGSTASMDLSHFRSNWKPEFGGSFGPVDLTPETK